MNRWLFLAFLVAILNARAVEPSGRPNVLLLIADDLRPELACYEGSSAQTPNLDRLARTGALFERAFCPQALCAPSRTALFTGLRPDTTKVWDVWTHFRAAVPDVVTLPQRLQRHGWFAQAFGKVYHSNLDDRASWSVPHTMPTDPLYGSPETQALLAAKRKKAEADGLKGVPLARAIRSGPPAEAPEVPDTALVDGQIADLAITALEKFQRERQTFFLAVGFTKPHLPFVAPKKYWELYDRSKIELSPARQAPIGAPPYALGDSGELLGYDGVPPPSEMSDDYQRWLRHGYLASVSYMDAQAGRVLDSLDRLGLRDNTIVIFWGDNGYKLGDYGAWTKTTNVLLDTRIPLIVRAPGVSLPGSRIRGMVEVTDLYPTLLDILKISAPERFEGTSFLPLLRDPHGPGKDAVFTQSPQTAGRQALMGYSIVTERYRLTRWLTRDARRREMAVELYDRQTDLTESRNVADEPAYTRIRADLLLRQEAHSITPGGNPPRPAP